MCAAVILACGACGKRAKRAPVTETPTESAATVNNEAIAAEVWQATVPVSLDGEVLAKRLPVRAVLGR